MAINLKKMEISRYKIPEIDLPHIIFKAEEDKVVKEWTSEEALSHFLHDQGITGFRGPEGSGKTLLMTRVATECHKLGGKILAFPGYELRDEKGKVLSELLTIEQWSTMPEELRDVCICIDEIENFFNSHRWQSTMVDLFTGVFGERRKRNMAILYTLQFWDELPRMMRYKTHYVFDCFDGAWMNAYREEPLREGTVTYTNITDNLGRRFGHAGYIYPGPTFYNKEYWDRFDTHSVVSIFEKYTKVQVKGKIVPVDLSGKPIEEVEDVVPPEDRASTFNKGIELQMALRKAGYSVREMAYMRSQAKTLGEMDMVLSQLLNKEKQES